MNWKEREKTTPQISKEELDKRYIKEELMRYDMYVGRVIDIKCDISAFEKKYEEEVNFPCCGGSVVKIPDASATYSNKVMQLICQLNDMEENLKYYENKLDTLDKWLDYITPSQQNIVKTYVLEYQCQSRHVVAAILKYSDETIKKQTERAINRIYSNFNKFM